MKKKYIEDITCIFSWPRGARHIVFIIPHRAWSKSRLVVSIEYLKPFTYHLIIQRFEKEGMVWCSRICFFQRVLFEEPPEVEENENKNLLQVPKRNPQVFTLLFGTFNDLYDSEISIQSISGFSENSAVHWTGLDIKKKISREHWLYSRRILKYDTAPDVFGMRDLCRAKMQ